MSRQPRRSPGANEAPGVLIAAAASGTGKTVLTAGLLSHLARTGLAVASAKAGPDYIDTAFHAAATGRPCLNLDPWAMRAETRAAVLLELSSEAELVICEGVMGLFDGAIVEMGSTADLAAETGWPVVLVIDARAQGASAAAVVRGFASHRRAVEVAAVVFNRVASSSHEAILREAMATSVPEIAVLGCLPRSEALALPARHLGLVQAREHPALADFLKAAGRIVAERIDVDRLIRFARPSRRATGPCLTPLPPLGQRIAVARDDAFAFEYHLVTAGWQRVGAEILPFSPLADEPPAKDADAVFLPGGYPELHAGKLASAGRFLAGLRTAHGKGTRIYGECGGYMIMGRGLVDENGTRHALADLLPVETSFAEPRLTLGYRRLSFAAAAPCGLAGVRLRGHEFHYARVIEEGPGQPFFHARDTRDRELGSTGLVDGQTAGSFVHLIDREGA